MKSLKLKIITPVVLLLLVYLVVITIQINSQTEDLNLIKKMDEQSYLAMIKTEQLKLEVVTIQEKFKEISASGTDHGYVKAEDAYKRALGLITDLSVLLPSQQEDLNNTKSELDQFYQSGITMAQTYQVSGQMAGNAAMEGFDPYAKSLGSKLDSLKLDAEINIKRDLKKINGSINDTILVSIGSAGLILLGIVILWGLLHYVLRPIGSLIRASEQLSRGEVDLKIQSTSKDELGTLTDSFARMAVNIQKQSEAAKAIAAGDLSIEITPNSEKDLLGISLIQVVESLNSLLDETSRLSQAAIEGKLESRGNEELLGGGYQEIIRGFNHTLDAFIDPMKLAADYISRISKGDIPEPIKAEYQGDFNEIKNNLNTCIDAVHALTIDAGALWESALSGNLSVRVDENRHQGAFQEIIKGINQTLDAIIEPISVATSYIEQIGQGQIPEKITDEYPGDFNQIKESINACIDGLAGLAEGNSVLRKMAKNDFNQKVEGSYQGIYREIAHSVNQVSDSINLIILGLIKAASGDFEGLEKLNQMGKQSENDQLMPAFINLIETIRSLVAETRMLSEAAVVGNLSHRGQISRFKGEYRKVIQGVNQTLDAVIEPIQEASQVLEKMANGNLQITMEGNYQGDHAIIKSSLNQTIYNMRGYISEISTVLHEISDGNLKLSISGDYQGDFWKIKESMNTIIESMTFFMEDVQNAAEQITYGSKQVSEGSQALSQGSLAQANSIQLLNDSVADISQQTRRNAVHADQVRKLATMTLEDVENGNTQMEKMVASMQDINESSFQISKIIKVIDDIAFQTNILALNAAVEAARAGVHGKGFSVVAEEVRNLAARSGAAASETAEMIENSIHKIQEGTRVASATAGAINGIIEKINEVSELIEGIADASEEQSADVEKIYIGIDEVSQIIQHNSATAEEGAAASEELTGQADLLKELLSRFRREPLVLTDDCM